MQSRSLSDLKVTELIAKMGPMWKELDPEEKKVCGYLAMLWNSNPWFQLGRKDCVCVAGFTLPHLLFVCQRYSKSKQRRTSSVSRMKMKRFQRGWPTLALVIIQACVSCYSTWDCFCVLHNPFLVSVKSVLVSWRTSLLEVIIVAFIVHMQMRFTL